MPIHLEIVTPEGKVYADDVDSVVVPTTTGEVGILPGHIPLLTELDGGAITVSKNGANEDLAVSAGFAQCVGDKVSILAEHAINAADIDEAEVAEAQKRAEEALKNSKEMSDEEIEMLESTVQYASIQRLLKAKKR